MLQLAAVGATFAPIHLSGNSLNHSGFKQSSWRTSEGKPENISPLNTIQIKVLFLAAVNHLGEKLDGRVPLLSGCVMAGDNQ